VKQQIAELVDRLTSGRIEEREREEVIDELARPPPPGNSTG